LGKREFTSLVTVLWKIAHIPTSPKQSQGWIICSSHFARTINKNTIFRGKEKKNVIFTFFADRFYTRLKIMTINKYKCDF
jgi:hypothetical protein